MFLGEEINQIHYYYEITVVHLYSIYLYISCIAIEIAVAIVLHDEFMRPTSGIMLILT